MHIYLTDGGSHQVTQSGDAGCMLHPTSIRRSCGVGPSTSNRLAGVILVSTTSTSLQAAASRKSSSAGHKWPKPSPPEHLKTGIT